MKAFVKYLLFVLCFVTLEAGAQESVSINAIDLDTNADRNKKEIFNLWKSYLESVANEDTVLKEWNSIDKQQYVSPDFLSSEGFLSPGLYGLYKMGYLNKVLEIAPLLEDPARYMIRSMFYAPLENDTYILAITRHIAAKEDDEYKLFNWTPYHTRNWIRKTVGRIHYIYYPEFEFDELNAEKANGLIDLFRDKLGTNIPDSITYYIAQNCDEIQKLKGFDYVITMGDNVCNVCGFTDRVNHIIYAERTHGENYQHELTRLINPSFPNAHYYIIQGLAEYFNTSDGQLGITRKEIFKIMDQWLKEHPKEDVINEQSEFHTMNNQVAPDYSIGMIICHSLYEKGGYKLLKEALIAGNDDDSFFSFLNNKIGVNQKNFNKWIRGQISRYVNEDFPSLQTGSNY